MKIFFDTEFYENGSTIELISIGMVREDSHYFYAETPRAKEICHMDPWLEKNVLPHLNGQRLLKPQIRSLILEFVGEKPEFWAYYADYDWVVLCQLFGRMIDLPKGWPMFCMDIEQLCVTKGDPRLPKLEGAEHNALANARWNKVCYEWLTSMKGDVQ